MPSDPSPVRRFQAISYQSDVPCTLERGTLIPYQRPPLPVPARTAWPVGRSLSLVVSTLVLLVSFIMNGFTPLTALGLDATASVSDAPTVYAAPPDPFKTVPLNYGAQLAMDRPDYFSQVHNSFVATKQSFIEADLSAMTITYYDHGSSTFTTTILAKGKAGSLWETPAGLYKIGSKEQEHYSTLDHDYQPWSMTFQGNFFINGWPEYRDGTPVPANNTNGCIRLSKEDAKTLYDLTAVGTPVLVHEADFKNDGFVYQPKVPDISAPEYLLGDIKNTTVLAAQGADTAVPIASLTKLVTAIVAVEHVNLDKQVIVSTVPDVPSVIPRLKAGQSVSMYTLLRLLLVESSNEAAEVIADQVGRSQFVNYMNETAASLGLTHTHFTDPAGFDSSNVSTANDLMRLSQYLYNNRSFVLKMTANQNVASSSASDQFGPLTDFNTVPNDPSFIGGKVGETDAAGETSVSLHMITVHGERRPIVIVLLGSHDRVADINALLNYVKERFNAVTP